MDMHYHDNTIWLEEIESALNVYRQDTGDFYSEPSNQDDISQENHPSKISLYKVEEKIRDAKHSIRRCRNTHIWMPALIQKPDEQGEDIPLNLHSLDARHRYEKALQKYKRLLDRYERLKAELQEDVYAEEGQ
jgi:hypothetical protein